MAVQQNRKTRSRRDMRRSHDALTAKTLSTDPVTGETHIRHHITPDGYYRGRKIIDTNKAFAPDHDHDHDHDHADHA